ncbi:MAG: hypothetical protein M3Z21_01550 [Pseudomonadota bacterium]|nr:hypothetical protein [Pseudomonadota bacterium]
MALGLEELRLVEETAVDEAPDKTVTVRLMWVFSDSGWKGDDVGAGEL